jgi:hypothetical protein
MLEAVRCQLRVADRVLDVPVPEIGLQRTGIMARIGQRKATGVPKHVRVDLEPKASRKPRPLQHPGEARRGKGCAPLTDEHEKGCCRRSRAANGAARVTPDRSVGGR